MEMNTFDSFRGLAGGRGVIFYFEGTFTENVIAAMRDTLRNRLEQDPDSLRKKRKIFSTFIEMAQNVAHYASATDVPLPDGRSARGPMGAVAVGKDGDAYFIASGNAILARHAPRLREKLDPLLGMNAEQIRDAYRAQLRNDDHADDEVSLGAGLGLLTIARDTSQPIEYAIVEGREDDGRLAHFFMRAVI